MKLIEISLLPREKISLAVDILQQASTKRIPKSEVSDQLSILSVHVYEHGLSPTDLKKAVVLLTGRSSLGTSLALQLVKLLCPREAVDDDVVVDIIGCLGVGRRKAETSIQVRILQSC